MGISTKRSAESNFTPQCETSFSFANAKTLALYASLAGVAALTQNIPAALVSQKLQMIFKFAAGVAAPLSSSMAQSYFQNINSNNQNTQVVLDKTRNFLSINEDYQNILKNFINSLQQLMGKVF